MSPAHRPEPTGPEHPLVSVVVPTLGRHELLARVLDHLADQTLDPARFEVLVVADAQVSATDRLARLVSSRPYRSQLLQPVRAGASAARNRGWRAAIAPVVLFVGDDVFPDRRLLEEHLASHGEHPERTAGVLGQVRWSSDLRVTPFMRWLEHGLQSSYATIEGNEAGWWHLYTTNASLKRELLEQVGGFDEDLPFLYEDTDLGKRMDRAGLRLLYNPAASAEHHHPATLEEWRTRAALIAAAEHRFCQKHPGAQPYFLELFRRARAQPPVGPAGARVARFVPQRFPWLGEPVWRKARRHFAQQLAPAFLEAWSQAEADEGELGESGRPGSPAV